MEMHFKLIGSLLIILAFLHVVFPWYFKWKQELAGLSIINRQLMYVHSLFIALAVLLVGVLCVTSASELLNTPLGRRISLGIGLFWGARLLIQFIGYSPATWRGKTFETVIHILISIFWIYLTTVFIMAYIG